ncbi:MAG TPA: alpha/beta fold hydrolase [Stellaceae bacterium]
MIDLLTQPRPADSLSLGQIITLWERTLGVSPIGPDDDFFDLGGDSLLALQMFHAIERITGRTLPITAIYEAATPAKLWDLLDGAAPAPFSPLVTIKPGRSGNPAAPLFIFHGIGGTVIELERVGRLIETDRAVIAVQARGVDGTAEPHDRLEAMIDFYLPALRARQPHGPYYLAGYSFGGLLAMEAARRLEAAGERVALLLFIDSFAHPNTFPKAARQIVRLNTVLHAFATMPPHRAVRFVLARLRGEAGPMNRAGQLLTGDAVAAKAPALRRVYDSANTALLHYWPQPYAGKIVFVRAKTSIFPVAPARIWGKLVAGIDLHIVDADHDSLVREDAPLLAATVSRLLSAAA